MNYYLYCFKRWLLRDEKLTHREAAYGILLTVIIIACGYLAIHTKQYIPAPQSAVVPSEKNIDVTSDAVVSEPTVPYIPAADTAKINPDTAKIAQVPAVKKKPVTNKLTANKSALKKSTKTQLKKRADEKRVLIMLKEGNSVRQIAKKTGLKKKFIREVKRRNKQQV